MFTAIVAFTRIMISEACMMANWMWVSYGGDSGPSAVFEHAFSISSDQYGNCFPHCSDVLSGLTTEHRLGFPGSLYCCTGDARLSMFTMLELGHIPLIDVTTINTQALPCVAASAIAEFVSEVRDLPFCTCLAAASSTVLSPRPAHL